MSSFPLGISDRLSQFTETSPLTTAIDSAPKLIAQQPANAVLLAEPVQQSFQLTAIGGPLPKLIEDILKIPSDKVKPTLSFDAEGPDDAKYFSDSYNTGATKVFTNYKPARVVAFVRSDSYPWEKFAAFYGISADIAKKMTVANEAGNKAYAVMKGYASTQEQIDGELFSEWASQNAISQAPSLGATFDFLHKAVGAKFPPAYKGIVDMGTYLIQKMVQKYTKVKDLPDAATLLGNLRKCIKNSQTFEQALTQFAQQQGITNTSSFINDLAQAKYKALDAYIKALLTTKTPITIRVAVENALKK